MRTNGVDKNHLRDEIKAILDENVVFSIATITDGGFPQASMVNFIYDEELNLYFMTTSETRKAKNLVNIKRVAIEVGTGEPPKTLQIEGMAELLQDQIQKEHLASQLIMVATKNKQYWPPLVSLSEKGEKLLYKVTPKWLRLFRGKEIAKTNGDESFVDFELHAGEIKVL